MTPEERYRGCLLGLAAGDALGTTLEFRLPGSFPPLEKIVGGGPFDLKPGQWTDDTSMALCLAESLIERQGFDPIDQLTRYDRWYREGYLSSTGQCFDIGNTTAAALRLFEKTGAAYCGSESQRTAGNGALVRLAPVPMAYAASPLRALEMAAASSRTTHAAQDSIDCSRYLAALIVGALQGAEKKDLLAPRYAPVPGYWHEHPLSPAVDEVASGSFLRRNPPQIRGSGYVVQCLEAALWAFATTDSFERGALKAVNLGDDADSTGAVFGQLAGAFYGENQIPVSWREVLALRKKIERYAELLLELSRTLKDAS